MHAGSGEAPEQNFMTWAAVNPAGFLKRWSARLWAPRAEVADSSTSIQPVAAQSSTASQPLPELKLRPEVEKSLLDAGMPPDGSSIYEGPKRAPDTPQEAAR